MRKFIIFTYSILLSTSTLAITLEEALEGAYNYSQDIKTNVLNFQNDIEQFPSALGNMLPDISANIDYSERQNKSISKLVPSPPSSNKLLQNSVTLNQPIFKGGAGVAGLKAAQHGFKAARSKYYGDEQKALYGVIQAYLECFEAYENYQIYDVSVKSNQNQYDAEEEKFRVGESTASNVASARAALAKSHTSKLGALARLEAAKANFLRIVGREAEDIAAPPLPEGLPMTFEELLNKTLLHNRDIEFARHNINSAKAIELASKGALLPKVNFRVIASRNVYDKESLNNINSQTFSSGISVDIPIYTRGGAEYSNIRQKKKESRLQVIKLEDQIRKSKANCIQVWQGFNAARTSVAAATEGVEAAQLAYDGTVQEEAVGTKVIGDVLKAEEALNQAKLQKVSSIKEYILNAYTMKALMGQLTAKALRLKVHYFSPETEFKKTKMKIIGF